MELRSVEAIARALNDANIQYIVVGGLAVNAHGCEPFDFATEWARTVRFSIGDSIEIPVLCYESLIKMKIDAGREKDLLDVSALRKIEPFRL